ASAGAALAYTENWYVLGASVLSDILNRGQGTLVSLNALARHRASDRLTFFGGPGLTWADGRYTRTFFGVSADQSAASGLPEFGTHPVSNTVRLRQRYLSCARQHDSYHRHRRNAARQSSNHANRPPHS